MKTLTITILPLVSILTGFLNGDIATSSTIPKQTNPTLYDQSDKVVQLDVSSFNDTIYCASRPNCTAYLVEFYANWCGICRAYRDKYKEFAKDVDNWESVIQIAAINCGDDINHDLCQAHHITSYPYIKYFKRNSKNVYDSFKVKAYHTVGGMRDLITNHLLAEQKLKKYPDWPNFDHIGIIQTYSELWTGVSKSITKLAVIFESEPNFLAPQLMLDMHHYKNEIAVKRCGRNHSLAAGLNIDDFPSIAIFERGQRVPVFISELRRLLFSEVESYFGNKDPSRNPLTTEVKSNRTVVNCIVDPELCKKKYFVSESDMLKAIRYALYREVTRNGEDLKGNNLTALFNFVNLLSDYFPVTTINETISTNEITLESASKAQQVFEKLKQYLIGKMIANHLKADDWTKEVNRLEKLYDYPFPVNASWQQCNGSSGQFRGYTCGLWTAFHALTVSAYKNAPSGNYFDPMTVLYSIKGWVSEFFGCMHCREHFVKMTSQTYKMEDHVKNRDDVYLYLWRAHNIVNKRLKGDNTEDPEFLKYQFPAPFLCPDCNKSNGTLDNEQTHKFIIDYYSAIKPYHSQQLENNDIAKKA
uniref:Sulfhydryl oxidase n=1 Tax=Rhabditophanes sp. KR3021 TaxID=114890 RepID=A0AC35TKM9_9BILA